MPQGRRVRGLAKCSSRTVEISNGEVADLLASRGFGSRRDGKLVLEPCEALYLVEKGRIEVLGEGGEVLDFQALLRTFEELDDRIWMKYLIYRDLRERGYVVKGGFGPGTIFRLYDRGDYGRKPARFLVYGILEGSPVRLSELEEALRVAQANRKELILAVVDRRGEVVYYSLSSWRKKAHEGGEAA